MIWGLAVPCVIPQVENAAFRYEHKRVAALEEIPSGEPVEFGCDPGYVVHGPEIMRCSLGKWNVTQNSTCIPGKQFCAISQIVCDYNVIMRRSTVRAAQDPSRRLHRRISSRFNHRQRIDGGLHLPGTRVRQSQSDARLVPLGRTVARIPGLQVASGARIRLRW